MKKPFLSGLVLLLLVCRPLLADLSTPMPWRVRDASATVKEMQGGAVVLPIVLPEEREFVCEYPDAGSGWPVEATWLELSFLFPRNFPAGVQLKVFAKDNDRAMRILDELPNAKIAE